MLLVLSIGDKRRRMESLEVVKAMDSISKKIGKVITKELQNNGIKCMFNAAYEGRALQIYDTKTGLYMWIRIKYNNTYDSAKLDMSNIQIPPKYRRKGIFTKVINKLKRMDCVTNIKIENVITDEMEAWCKKHRFKVTYECDIPSYYWKLMK